MNEKKSATKKPNLIGFSANSLTFGISAVKLYLSRYRLEFITNQPISVKCSVDLAVSIGVRYAF